MPRYLSLSVGESNVKDLTAEIQFAWWKYISYEAVCSGLELIAAITSFSDATGVCR